MIAGKLSSAEKPRRSSAWRLISVPWQGQYVSPRCCNVKLYELINSVGGLIVESISWRFIFWIISIAHVVLQIVGLIFHHESYVPKILADEVRRLKSRTGNSNLHTKWMTRNASILSTLWLNIKRPFIMLTTQPAIQAIGLYRAYFYGVKYLM